MLIKAICSRGHEQTISVPYGRDEAQNLAGLLDGSSDMFLHKPGPESVIGKCGLCGQPFRCQVLDDVESPELQP